MRLKHSIDFARTDRVGPSGVAPEALADTLKRTEPALAWLRARHADSSLPLLRLPAKHDDLVSIKDAARRLTNEVTMADGTRFVRVFVEVTGKPPSTTEPH